MSSFTTLTGQLLIAMPQMDDPHFEHSVVYLFAHDAQDGAMGIIINKVIDDLTEEALYEHLKIEPQSEALSLARQRVHFGGPVGTEMGFVLHSADYREDSTAGIGNDFALTTSFAVLRAMSKGEGPRQHILALGYAGWGPGQLEAEIQSNGWLLVDADAGLVFDGDDNAKWTRALAKLGVKPEMLTGGAGRA
jgi:putative transcriptional regulator